MNSGPGMIWEGLNVMKFGRVMLREINLADPEPVAISASKWAGTSSTDSANKEISLSWGLKELHARLDL